MHKKKLLTLILFLLIQSLIAQEKMEILDSLEYYNSNEAYKKAILYASKINSKVPSNKKGSFYLSLGASYENLNKEDSAFVYYQLALKTFKRGTQDEDIAETNKSIYNLLDSQNNLKIDKQPYFDALESYAIKSNSKKWLASINNTLAVKYFDTDMYASKRSFLKALKFYELMGDRDKEATILSNLGVLYTNKMKDTDSARFFLNRAMELLKSDAVKINTKFNIFNNIGNSYKTDGNYLKAIEYFKIAEALDLKKYNLNCKKIIYSNMDASYYYLNDFENAYTYFYKYDSVKELINLKEQNTLITDVEERYKNEKLRADNLESEAKRKQNRNLLFASLAVLIFGGLIAFLTLKNSRKKQLLAEQEKALETQKLATVLKEQELVTIDAMIEGQEKERQRIADDLHDDLGGLMTTVKWQFDAFKEHQSPELFDKTNELLEEAYQKIRGIAHAKNAGVIAKQGLLKAVQNIAEKISDSNKINIEVMDYGLENRLENSLELMLFRIIQELITNIIKHAHATNVTIHLTNHEDSINIMVEDDGICFNTSQITTTNKGMGISSIDKRVEHLNGKMTIESEPNMGTTIIIDIPM